jgi:uncharacterized protein
MVAPEMEVSTVERAAEGGTERDLDYADLFARFVAAVIDNTFWVVSIFYVIGYIPASVAEDHPEAVGLVVLGLLSVWFNYFAFCEWRWGQTIGKNAMGIRVAELDGGRISFGASTIRNAFRLVDWLVVGWVMIARTERHQRLGDKAAKTVVVRRPRPQQSSSGATTSGAPRATAPPATEAAPQTRREPERAEPKPDFPGATWSLSTTIWGLIGGLVLALLLAPALILPFDPDFESLASKLAGQGLLGVCLLGVAFGIAAGWRRDALGAAANRLGLRRFSSSAVGWMVVTLVAYYLAAALFAALVIAPDQEDIGGDLGLGGESVLAAAVAVILIVGLAPIAEEVFFRGFLFGGLRTRLSLWPAALIAGVVFGLIHAPTGITAVVPLAMLGVGLSWLYERTGSLGPPIILHVFNNGLALAVAS